MSVKYFPIVLESMIKNKLHLVFCLAGFTACATPTSIRNPAATSQDLVDFELPVKTVNMFEVREGAMSDGGVKKIQKHNDKLIELLSNMEAPQVTGNWKASLELEDAHKLFAWLEAHPVASSHMLMKYDPNENIGFCFGRATAVHLEALGKPYKLHPSAIRKIWVFGPMKGGWGHHVATIVLTRKNPEGHTFVVVDPVTGVITAEKWIKDIRKNYQISAKDPLMYFVTDPSRFGPYPGKYTRMDLFGPDKGNRDTDAYRGYFDDLMTKFRIDSMARVPASDKVESEFLQAFKAEFESVPKIAEKSSEGREEILVQMEFDFVKDL